MAVSSAATGEADRTLPADEEGFAWESSVPSDCPFPGSPSLTERETQLQSAGWALWLVSARSQTSRSALIEV